MPGSKAKMAPMSATMVSSMLWKVPLVTHKKSTSTKIATAFHSSALILPRACSSVLRRSNPPSIWGTCSSFLIGKNTYMPISKPITKMSRLTGVIAISQSV